MVGFEEIGEEGAERTLGDYFRDSKLGAGYENRTRVSNLEGCDLATRLTPQTLTKLEEAVRFELTDPFQGRRLSRS